MGVYDTIVFNCPSCGYEMSAQSKSGECTLQEYNHKEVPIGVAYDVNRHAPFKCKCGKNWYFEDVEMYDDNYNKVLTLKEWAEQGA
jgi:hypothetical protein